MNQEQASLLVVDDNEINRDMLSRRLGRSGYAVTAAECGVKAQTLIEQQQFDLVLLDIMMPGISGLDVLTWLRNRRDSSDIAVIMVTAKAESEDVVEALELGANDYVTKPIDFPVLLARIKAQLSRKSIEDRLLQDYQNLELQVKEKTSTASDHGTSQQPERKYVTVLFSDLNGYTAMSERVNPEDLREIINAVLGCAQKVITHHGGVTEKFIGDAIMAVFGKEKTYEDDPIRP